jgi:hypothetical protein
VKGTLTFKDREFDPIKLRDLKTKSCNIYWISKLNGKLAVQFINKSYALKKNQKKAKD